MQKRDMTKPLDRYLSPVDVWAMSFGCMVGWGVFAMPGNTFLPVAGPAGTVIAMGIGMVIMLIIGANFSYLMARTPITGGVYTYTKDAFGRSERGTSEISGIRSIRMVLDLPVMGSGRLR